VVFLRGSALGEREHSCQQPFSRLFRGVPKQQHHPNEIWAVDNGETRTKMPAAAAAHAAAAARGLKISLAQPHPF